jgi:DNA helicase-2/ATP-dependent DNA helicase PcrA
MIPSVFQQNIFDFISNESAGSLMIQAVAGSGKTTTIVKAIGLIPQDKKVIMLAFNKKIAEELSERVKLDNVTIKTFHAVGLQVCRSLVKNPKIDSSKVNSIIREYEEYFEIDKSIVNGWDSLSKIISIGKNSGIGSFHPNEEKSWMNVINHHDIFRGEDVDYDVIIPALIKILDKNNKMKQVIDFDDMVYFPILFNLKFPKFDWVFADEVQDASEINRAALKELMNKTGRLCVVGDPFQAIYGFRGADSESMNMLKEEFNCTSLPLSVSYRCSKSVVKEAQTVVSHILASDTASDGSVSTIAEYSPDSFTKNSAIICRNTAPLVKFTYSLISKGIPAIMLGRDIGKGLISLIKSMKVKSIEALESKLLEWRDRTVKKAAEKGEDALIDAVNDKWECINLFISATKSKMVADLVKEIDLFFSDTSENGKITLATVHKSKGLEWDNVFILDRKKFYPKWATMNWMKEQERNIHYVAITRAKSQLSYIDSDSWK